MCFSQIEGDCVCGGQCFARLWLFFFLPFFSQPSAVRARVCVWFHRRCGLQRTMVLGCLCVLNRAVTHCSVYHARGRVLVGRVEVAFFSSAMVFFRSALVCDGFTHTHTHATPVRIHNDACLRSGWTFWRALSNTAHNTRHANHARGGIGVPCCHR